MLPTRVVVLTFDGVSLFHLSVPGMVFGADEGPGQARYDIAYCAQTPGQIRSDQGVMIGVSQGLGAMADADIIIVPAWRDGLEPTSAELTAALRQADARGTQIVGLCLGAFALGHAGLLDGREATTHWVARELFAQTFPQTLFRPDVLYVEDGNIMTSAGTVAAIDCCLHLVRERHGSEAANHVARLLVTPPHRAGGQAQYIERPLPRCAGDDRVPGVLEWARENLSQELSVDALAAVARMSRRTFTRRFREATGTTVTKWLNTERVARAQQLLETTDLSIELITAEAGFGTPLALRQQFAAQLGISPSGYRRTFTRQAAVQGRSAWLPATEQQAVQDT